MNPHEVPTRDSGPDDIHNDPMFKGYEGDSVQIDAQRCITDLRHYNHHNYQIYDGHETRSYVQFIKRNGRAQ